MIFAHVGGVPVEEALPALASGLGTTVLVARAWLLARVRRAQPAASSTCTTSSLNPSGSRKKTA